VIRKRGRYGIDDYDAELYELIRELVTEGELDEKSDAYGIAMQAVTQGLRSLSDKQLYVYQKEVGSLLKKRQPPRDIDPT